MIDQVVNTIILFMIYLLGIVTTIGVVAVLLWIVNQLRGKDDV